MVQLTYIEGGKYNKGYEIHMKIYVTNFNKNILGFNLAIFRIR